MIGDGLTPTELELAGCSVEKSPVTADRPLLVLLPWLIEGLDHVDTEPVALGDIEDVVNGARLVRWRWQRAIAHAPGARPTDLADQDLLAGKRLGDLAMNGGEVGGGGVGRNRKILPIGKDMDGDEVDRVG